MASAPSGLSGLRADPVIARCAPFAVFLCFLILGSALNAAGHAEPWLLVVRSVVVALVLAWFWPAYAELRSPPPLRAAHVLAAVGVGLVVFALWIVLDQRWAALVPGAGFEPTRPDGSIDWVLACSRLAGFALVVPVMEELFWRGFLLRWLVRHDFLEVRPGEIGLPALAITAVLFALEHNQWLASAMAGIAYSLLYMRTGNLWLAVLAHAVTNGVLGVWVLWTRNWQFW